jgi:hypothetical protein
MSYFITPYTRRHSIGKVISNIIQPNPTGRIHIEFIDGTYLALSPSNGSIIVTAYDKNNNVINSQDDDTQNCGALIRS